MIFFSATLQTNFSHWDYCNVEDKIAWVFSDGDHTPPPPQMINGQPSTVRPNKQLRGVTDGRRLPSTLSPSLL